VKRTLLAVAILIAVPAIGQEVEHAPTVAQCQADQRLWLSKLEGPESGLDGESARQTMQDKHHRDLRVFAKAFRRMDDRRQSLLVGLARKMARRHPL